MFIFTGVVAIGHHLFVFCCKDTKIPATSKEIAGNFGLFSSFLFVLNDAFLQVFQHADVLGVGGSSQVFFDN